MLLRSDGRDHNDNLVYKYHLCATPDEVVERIDDPDILGVIHVQLLIHYNKFLSSGLMLINNVFTFKYK